MIFVLLAWHAFIINGITFLLFGLDKLFAIKHMYRVPEKALIGLCIAGGSLGGLCGIYLFRHKTKRKVFKLSVFLALLCQLLVLGVCILRYNNIF